MLNSLVILSIILLFAHYEILLIASRLLAPSQAFGATERLAKRAVGRIFMLMRRYGGVELAFENRSGSELPKRFLLIANHQSLMDIPLCIALFPEFGLRFVAKRELGDGIPFVSLLLRSQGHALVRRRGSSSQAMRSIRRFARRCEREGTCPVIFPEGTRSRDGEVGEFHTAGVRKILGEARLPMVVAVVEGGWRLASMKGLLRNLRGARIGLRVLSVTPPLAAKAEVLAALAAARTGIAGELARIRAGNKEKGPSK